MSVCFRHAEKAAKRKCYRCRRIICMDCYHRRDKHIFCSRNCYLQYKVRDLGTKATEISHRRLPLAAFLVTLIVLVAPIGFVLTRAASELDSPIFFWYPAKARPQPTVAAAITAIEEREQTMSVVGNATPGALIFLLRNGKTIENAHATPEAKFRFELPLESSAATYAVAAVAPKTLASTSFQPDRQPPATILRASVRSNQTRFVENFTRGPLEEPNLVLSFDAGSSDRGARQILDTLRDHGIRTTIFLTGQFIERFPDVVREIVSDGHEVGNHTYSHPHLTSFAKSRRQVTLPSMTKERFQSELKKTEDLFHQVTGSSMAKYWRAPFGEENSEIRGWAAELGYLHVGWTKGPRYNLDSLDWVIDRQSPMYLSPEKLAERLLNFDAANNTTLNGGIILMHLGTDRGEDERLERALPMMIQRFQERGFRFVKVSDLKGRAASAG